MSQSSLTGALSIDQFCTDNAISKATAYRQIASGHLQACKVGARTVITRAAAQAWLDALPKFGADGAGNDVAA